MSSTTPQKPRKPRKSRAKKVNVSLRSRWEQILKTVHKDEVPVEVLESIMVNLVDGTTVSVNIRELIEDGQDPRFIEEQIFKRLASLDSVIEDVDFYICIDSLAKTVQPITDNLLKNL